MLAVFITRDKDRSCSSLGRWGCLSILLYAYDIVLFLEHDLAEAKNLKLKLCAFKQLSDLKINFHKSLFLYGEAQSFTNEYIKLFNLGVKHDLFHLDIWEFHAPP